MRGIVVTWARNIGSEKFGHTDSDPAVQASTREWVTAKEGALMDLLAALRTFEPHMVLEEQKDREHADTVNELIQSSGRADNAVDNSANDEQNKGRREWKDPHPPASASVLRPCNQVVVCLIGQSGSRYG
jgi:hypothetical protein